MLQLEYRQVFVCIRYEQVTVVDRIWICKVGSMYRKVEIYQCKYKTLGTTGLRRKGSTLDFVI